MIARLFVLACTLCHCVYATCVIVARTPELIVIGADSKSSYIDGAPGPLVCKIRCTNKVYAYARLGAERDINLDAFDVADRIFREDGTITERVARVEREVVPMLNTILGRVKEFFPSHLSTDFREGGAALEMVFAGFDADVATVILERFIFHSNPTRVWVEPDKPKRCPPDCPPDGQLYASIGEHDAADKLRIPNSTWEEGIASGVTKLISAQSKATPQFVGRPISVVSITRTGATWNSQGECSKNCSKR